MTTKIKLPKDAEGREVPLDTEVMYDANGKKVRITSFTYTFNVIGLWGQWKVFSPDIRGEKDGELPANSLYLIPHDSWEKLEEDLDKCISSNNICRYLSESGECYNCTVTPDKACLDCDSVIFSSIKERIRNLRSKE